MKRTRDIEEVRAFFQEETLEE